MFYLTEMSNVSNLLFLLYIFVLLLIFYTVKISVITIINENSIFNGKKWWSICIVICQFDFRPSRLHLPKPKSNPSHSKHRQTQQHTSAAQSKSKSESQWVWTAFLWSFVISGLWIWGIEIQWYFRCVIGGHWLLLNRYLLLFFKSEENYFKETKAYFLIYLNLFQTSYLTCTTAMLQKISARNP